MTYLDSKELKVFILDLYNRYINGENIDETAKKIFLDYVGSEDFIEKELHEAILYLETIGWNLNPSKIEAKKILEELKEEEKYTKEETARRFVREGYGLEWEDYEWVIK